MKKLLGSFAFVLLSSVIALAQQGSVPTPQWRPVYHFTPEKNWTNDPNGLIYLNGVYHLYNQQNPFENKWGHMSWGHATSTDLVHWKHLPIAIPEIIDNKDTTWIFSGCAVWDKNNTSGFCKTGGCMVVIYTADQPHQKKESQYVAYSNDGGMTFKNYEHNPVIDLHKKDFRDPNVTWNEELKKWVMVVVVPNEHKAQFYASDNLTKWDFLSEFGPAGYTGAAWECPSLIQLPVENASGSAASGSANPGTAKKKWALLISAAGGPKGVFMQYFTGDFSKGVFTNDNATDKTLTVDYGDCFYAAIPWNPAPTGKKILIGWMMQGKAATYPWKGQMSIPRDLSLRSTSEGLRLVQTPTSVITGNRSALAGQPVLDKKDLAVNNKEIPLLPTTGNAYWIRSEWDVPAGAKAGFVIAGKASITYDGATHQLTATGTSAETTTIDLTGISDLTGTAGSTTGKDGTTTGAGRPLHLEILVDRSSLEVFVSNGEKVLTTHVYPDGSASGLTAVSTGGNATIRNLKVWDLSKLKK
jgi:fructan beta-fructosidase